MGFQEDMSANLCCAWSVRSAVFATWELCSFDSLEWWPRHRENTSLLNVEVAGSLPEGWKLWREWNELCARYGRERLRRMASQEAEMLEVDDGRTFCFTRLIAQKLF
jgi:hypothetical protein